MSEIFSIELLVKKLDNYKRLHEIIIELDNYFMPKLSLLVDIDKYVGKMFDNAHIYILKDKSIDIGLCAIYLNDIRRKVAFITLLGLLPKYQSMGLGSKLIKNVIEKSKEEGFLAIELEVSKGNFKAKNFYYKNGFAIKEEREKSLILSKNI